MVADAILSVGSAQRDGRNDCTSARVWLGANVNSTSPKAVKLSLRDLLESRAVRMAVRVVRSVEFDDHG